ncbi:MAG: Capsular polysaccharide biosynthesis protein I, partial [Candidatus Daviesbacteria bacterium GW2011_GWA1_38_7]
DAHKNFLPLQKGDVPATFADIEQTTKVLGWKPKVTIEEGIKEFVRWYRDYY